MPSDILFTELKLANITLPNRLVRSATYEGWGDADGFPRLELAGVYSELARGGVGTIITGFAYVTKAGRAMQPGQCGIDSDDKIAHWQTIVDAVRATGGNCKQFMQIAHTGRQTRQEATGGVAVGASARPCSYFRQPTRGLDDAAILEIIRQFADAAFRAKEAGFDGVQVHAAHGYLIHQFLSPCTNNRTDRWADRGLLLEEIIRAIREKCGGFPILVKLSAADDNTPGVLVEDTIETVRRIGKLGVDAVEISYGTMERALNIIRGDAPLETVLRVNPMFGRMSGITKLIWKKLMLPAYRKTLIPFCENYNLESAVRIKQETGVPVIAVGGIRSQDSMIEMVENRGIDAVSLCRPLICEPDIPRKILAGEFTRSACVNCNLCTIYSDTNNPLRCYRKKGTRQ